MMRPAFSSTKSAAAFAFLLLLILLSPVLAGKKLLPPREQAYAVQGWGNGPYPWIRHEIFEETNAIDIAFVGSSHMMKGINTPQVQAALSEKLGHPAVVRTVAWGGAGFDGLYFITQDLLAHRRVRMLVFYDENPGGGLRNSAATAWFRFGDNVASLKDLPLADKGLFYLASLIGMPRNLLSLIRPNMPAELFSNHPGYIKPADMAFSDAPNRQGAVATPLGFNSNPVIPDYAPFVHYQPPATNYAVPAIYSALNPSRDFEFSIAPLPVWQVHFAHQFALLAEKHGCKLVMLHIPTLENVREAVIPERAFWPAIFSTNLTLVGVPARQLFFGLTDDEIKKLFSDKGHFNQNGMEFFTRLITPALLQSYDAPPNH